MMDWLPTFAQLAGAPIPDDRVIDGQSLVGVLKGTGDRDTRPSTTSTCACRSAISIPRSGPCATGAGS